MDVPTKEIVGALEDELGAPVRSERLVEIDFAAGQPATPAVRSGSAAGDSVMRRITGS